MHQGVLALVVAPAVYRVHDDGDAGQARRPPAQDAGLARVGVDDVVAAAPDEAGYADEGQQVSCGIDLAHQRWLDGEGDTAHTNLFDETAFGAGLRTGEDIYVETGWVEHGGDEHDGLLCSADDEARDDL